MKEHVDIEGFLKTVYIRSHSDDAVTTYRSSITKLQKYLKEKYKTDLDHLIPDIKNDKQDVYEFLRDFVIHLDSSGLKAATIETIIAGVKGLFRYCRIKIYNEDFKQLVPIPKRMRPVEMPMTKKILAKLLKVLSFKMQTAVIFCLASGVRIGELVQLTLDDIDFDSTPTTINIRAETTKTREARITFITEEATQILKDYLKRYYQWEEGKENSSMNGITLFGRTSMSKVGIRKSDSQLKMSPLSTNRLLLQKTLSDCLKKHSNLNMKVNGNRYAIHFHNFRKFNRTTVGSAVGRDFAEALIGHKFYMDTYVHTTLEEKKKLYLKAEPYLTISNFENVEKNLKIMEDRYAKLEQNVNGLMEYLRTNSIQVSESFTS